MHLALISSWSYLRNCCSIYKSFGLRQQISFLIDFNHCISQPTHQMCPSFDATDITAIYRLQLKCTSAMNRVLLSPRASWSAVLSSRCTLARKLFSHVSWQKGMYSNKPSFCCSSSPSNVSKLHHSSPGEAKIRAGGRQMRLECTLGLGSNKRRTSCCHMHSIPTAEHERLVF